MGVYTPSAFNITYMSNNFIFEKELQEGLIIKRKSQFTMIVNLNGNEIICHCPTTGRIGNISLENIPCLLSSSNNPTRKTPYTVEAISLDPIEDSQKKWVGINQNAANRYVEHFIITNQLPQMIKNGTTLKREQILGNSKLDFWVNNTYIEVKTPLLNLQLPIGEHIKTKKVSEFNSFERFVKHINSLADSLKVNESAILLNCFIYDNKHFIPQRDNKCSNFVGEQVANCINKGVEMWQINFQISPTEVSLLDYFSITEDFF